LPFLAINSAYIFSFEYSSVNQDLKVYTCFDVDCSTGQAQTLDNLGDVGILSSITIDINGFPIISYIDSTNKKVKVFSCTDAYCSK
jgi:hypothetical protein